MTKVETPEQKKKWAETLAVYGPIDAETPEQKKEWLRMLDVYSFSEAKTRYRIWKNDCVAARLGYMIGPNDSDGVEKWRKERREKCYLDLNGVQVREEDGPLPDNSVLCDGVQVHFRDLIRKLAFFIEKPEVKVVAGCVAWLTQPDILDALAKKRVAIVVQKEDFLRPEGARKLFQKRIHRLYGNLRGVSCRAEIGLGDLCSHSDTETIDAVRCVGNYNRDKEPAFPRMHNKFLLFGGVKDDEFSPFAVWTGSFNLTLNAGKSFENAVVMTAPQIVAAYYKEFQHIMSLSEPLDWTKDWMEPEWRVGS